MGFDIIAAGSGRGIGSQGRPVPEFAKPQFGSLAVRAELGCPPAKGLYLADAFGDVRRPPIMPRGELTEPGKPGTSNLALRKAESFGAAPARSGVNAALRFCCTLPVGKIT